MPLLDARDLAKIYGPDRVLADPELYKRGGAEVVQTKADLEAAHADAPRLTSRWEELAEREENAIAR